MLRYLESTGLVVPARSASGYRRYGDHDLELLRALAELRGRHEVELDDVAQPWGRDELTVVPSGFIPPNPSELLSSKAMETLLSTLGDMYDVIVIDTPPLLSVTDAALIARLVDTMLLVVATGRTRREDVRRAVDRLTAVGTRPRGAILTMTRHRRGTDPYYRYVPNEQRPAAPALRRLSFLPARST